jgi:hypothetical protein
VDESAIRVPSTADDALGALAAAVERPRESLSAFAALTPAQLNLLTQAVQGTATRRQAEIDAAIRRALPRLLSGGVARVLRGRPELERMRALLAQRARRPPPARADRA